MIPDSLHGTVVALDGLGVLLRGASGAGKSDLALRLMAEGAMLVADDRVVLDAADGRVRASAPSSLAGLIELRGVGIVRRPFLASAPLALVVDLVAPETVERMPEPAIALLAGHPVRRLALAAFEASTPVKIRFALVADSPGGGTPMEYNETP